MKVYVLASGSKGNCVYVEGSDSALLIDAGISACNIIGNKNQKGRIREAGGDPELIKGLLVTHEHSDHIKGAAPVGNKLSVPVYGTKGTLKKFIESRNGSKTPKVSSLSYNQEYCIDEFKVTPFAISHDAEEPCGFMVTENGNTLCCCTDTGIVTEQMVEKFKKSDILILESNHCPEMLENGPYPLYLKERIASATGHLSNHAAADVLRVVSDNLHSVILAHLSEVNNEPYTAAFGASEGLGSCGDDTEMFVASSIECKEKPSYIKKPGKSSERWNKKCWEYCVEI